MEKKLGKIENVYFGIGGYQDAEIGLHVTLSSDSWVFNYSKSTWDSEIIKHTERCKWTESDRDLQHAKIVRFISKLLKEAKVNTVEKLKGIPIEATFEGKNLKEWRVLTEVI